MRSGWSAWLIAGLAMVAVAMGLYLTGGPDRARKEKRDREREQDLMVLANWVDCVAARNGRLPKQLQDDAQCDWQVRRIDPFTDKPYLYEVLAPRRYRVCASFDLPPQHPGQRWGRDEGGCVVRDFIPHPGAQATIPYNP